LKEKIEYKTGEKEKIIENYNNFQSVALLTNSFTSQSLSLKKGTSIKGLSIQLSEEWLKNNVKDLTAEKIEILKQQTDMVDFITARHRKILLALINNTQQSYLPELFIKSHVLQLTEEFLDNLCRRGLKCMPEFTNPKDFTALVNVENLITKQNTTEFPSIEALAKAAYMSESKLKKLFKKAYGMAIYQYYQKNRMHKAKELLHSRKHSISQVGVMLGYQNMSNFSAAFKKEFSCLPSQFRQAV
jgi:AraC-like DNA-binding protein